MTESPYSQLQLFERAVIKDQYSSGTTNYLGYTQQIAKAGLIKRHKALGPESFMKTEHTWRACKGCRGTGVISKCHMITNQWSMEPHLSCKGRGEVYG